MGKELWVVWDPGLQFRQGMKLGEAAVAREGAAFLFSRPSVRIPEPLRSLADLFCSVCSSASRLRCEDHTGYVGCEGRDRDRAARLAAGTEAAAAAPAI